MNTLRDHGAIGDGITDDTDAVQAAVKVGGLIHVPVGKYRITSVRIPDGQSVTLWGEGQGRSVFLHDTSAAGDALSTTGTAEWVGLRDLTIDGLHDSTVNRQRQAVRLTVRHADLRGVEFRHTTRAALRFDDVAVRAVVDYCWFHDMATHSGIRGENTAACVVVPRNAGTGEFWFTRNRLDQPTDAVAGNGVGGVYISAPKVAGDTVGLAVFILDNVFRGMGQHIARNIVAPIQVYRNASQTIIRGNKVYDSRWGGIKVQRADDVLVEGNLVLGEKFHGRTTVSAIHLSTRAPTRDQHRAIVRGNIVRGFPSAGGIGVGYTAAGQLYDVLITENIVEEVDRGILLSYPAGMCQISRNTVRNILGTSPGAKGIYLKFATNDLTQLWITDNHVEQCNNEGIFAIGRAASGMPSTAITASLTVTGNRVLRTGRQAIKLWHLRTVTCMHNQADGNINIRDVVTAQVGWNEAPALAIDPTTTLRAAHNFWD